MTNTPDSDEFTATDMRIALNEVFPESTYGAIPVIDQYDALQTYLADRYGALQTYLADRYGALQAYLAFEDGVLKRLK